MDSQKIASRESLNISIDDDQDNQKLVEASPSNESHSSTDSSVIEDSAQNNKSKWDVVKCEICKACNFEAIAASGDVNTLDMVINMDRSIKKRMRQIDSKTAEQKRKIVKSLKPLKYLILFIYFFLPYFNQPSWCIDNPEITNIEYCYNQDNTILNSNLPKLSPMVTGPIDIFCVIYLYLSTYVRRYYRRHTQGSLYAERIQLFITLVSVIEYIITMISYETTNFYKFPWCASTLRPILLVLLVRVIREYWKRYFFVIYDSAFMVVFILVYVMYFSWMAQRIFSGTLEGVQQFDNFQNAFYNMFVCLTTSNFPNVMLPCYGQNRLSSLFFIVFLTFGLFLLMNLLLAIFYNNFKHRTDNTIENGDARRAKFFTGVFFELDEDDNGHLSKRQVKEMLEIIHSLVSNSEYNKNQMKLNNQEFELLFKIIDVDETETMEPHEFGGLFTAYEQWRFDQSRNKRHGGFMEANQNNEVNLQNANSWEARKQKFKNWTYSAKYELGINLLGVVDMVSLIIRTASGDPTIRFITIWMKVQISINSLLFLELILDFAAAGVKEAFDSKFRTYPETLCQILNIIATTRFILAEGNDEVYNELVKYYEVIIFIRMLKMLTMMYEVKTMRVIIETIKNLIAPLTNFLIIQLTIFNFFSIIGLLLFGGEIRSDSPAIITDPSVPDNYALMNFNDLLSAQITLFSLIIVNNWMVCVEMCVNIKGGNIYYRYFFIIFYYFGVIIGLNIIIAFAIDMYGSVERLDQQQQSNEDKLIELADDFESGRRVSKATSATLSSRNSIPEIDQGESQMVYSPKLTTSPTILSNDTSKSQEPITIQ